MAAGPNPIAAGLACRCPNCGKGPLFDGFLKVRARCPACGFDLARTDTGDGPAVFAIFILGFLICGAALYVEFTFEPPVWVHLVVWGLGTPLVALGLLRFLKALLIALQYRNKAEEGRIARD